MPALPPAVLGSVFHSIGGFFTSLSEISLVPLLLALLCFAVYISLRTRAWFHAVRAAYPESPIRWRNLWGAYWATFGINNVVPFRGGEVIRLALGRASVPGSSYPAIASSFFVEHLFDASLAIVTLSFAFTQGVFPKPPDFASLHAFDLSWAFGHARLSLFLLTVLMVGALLLFAVLSDRAARAWARARQGWTIVGDRRRYFREVWAVQLVGTVFRFAAFWAFLDAFHVGGSVRGVLLVCAVNTIATALPLTPGGAGVQQALLIKVFQGHASSTTVAAYAVGQQISIAILSGTIGLVALFTVFRFRSFGEALRFARAQHAAGEHQPGAPDTIVR